MIRVRSEQNADRERIFALQTAAFAQPGEAEIVNALRVSAHPQISLVAEFEGELAGHIFFSPVSIYGSAADLSCAGLGPVGVLPAHQRCGVGSALIRSGLDRCSKLGWKAVFLVGDPAFYARFGFVLAAPRGLRYESEAFDSVFQVVELHEGALQESHGWVRFNEAFGDENASQ